MNNALYNYILIQGEKFKFKKCGWCRWYDDSRCRSICYALCRHMWRLCEIYPSGCNVDEGDIMTYTQLTLERYFMCW